jgi:hypothetical protein
MNASPGITPGPFIIVLCPFVGHEYTVRCPRCEIGSSYRESDGDVLRLRPVWKYCELGHKFLVRLDDNIPFERVAFVDGTEHPHPMESSKKKARVGPSRTEGVSITDKVRGILGVVAPLDMRKMKPAPLYVHSTPTAANSPPLNMALAAQLAAPGMGAEKEQAPCAAGNCVPRSGRANRFDISDDEEDIDVDAALRTMCEIEAETSMACEEFD